MCRLVGSAVSCPCCTSRGGCASSGDMMMRLPAGSLWASGGPRNFCTCPVQGVPPDQRNGEAWAAACGTSLCRLMIAARAQRAFWGQFACSRAIPVWSALPHGTRTSSAATRGEREPLFWPVRSNQRTHHTLVRTRGETVSRYENSFECSSSAATLRAHGHGERGLRAPGPIRANQHI